MRDGRTELKKTVDWWTRVTRSRATRVGIALCFTATGGLATGCSIREEIASGTKMVTTRKVSCDQNIINSSDGYCTDPAHVHANGMVGRGTEVTVTASPEYGTEHCGCIRVSTPDNGTCWLKSGALSER